MCFILLVSAAFFWSAFEQKPTSFNLFANDYTNRMIGDFEIPAVWFQSINALFIILLAPVFTLLFRWSGQDQKRLRFSFALSAALFGWLNYTSSVWLYPTAQCLLMACGSMAGIAASGFVILYLYNGQRAARGKKFSHWFFYLFYPVHLLVLGVIRVMG